MPVPELVSATIVGSPLKCFRMLCQRQALMVCGRCKETTARVYYCSGICQKRDWRRHSIYCNKHVYILEAEIMNSESPAIIRRVVVPTWWSFRQFHYVLQYIFGLADSERSNTFQFVKKYPDPEDEYMCFRSGVIFEVHDERSCHKHDEDSAVTGTDNCVHEQDAKLSSVFGPSGIHRSRVDLGGDIAPLIYHYDFGGDSWVFKIAFKGTLWARGNRPTVIRAEGCGPIKGCGGLHRWNEIKAAFAAVSPTTEQQELREWARSATGCVDFNPFEEPSLDELNRIDRWESYIRRDILRSKDP